MLSNANFVVGNRQNTTGRRNNTTYAIDGWFSFGLLVVVVVSLLLQTYFVLFCRCCCCFGWKCLRVSIRIVKREAAGMHTHSFQLHDDGRWTYHADAAMLSAHNTSIHTHTRACIWGVCGTHKHTLHTHAYMLCASSSLLSVSYVYIMLFCIPVASADGNWTCYMISGCFSFE